MLGLAKFRRRIGFLTLTCLLGALVFGWSAYRNFRLQKLFLEASGVPPYFRGTQQAEEATRAIGTYRSETAEEFLYQIASGQTAIVWPSVQAEAVEQLKKRNDPRASEILAGFLQPHTLIDTRRSAAQALQSLPCDYVCTVFVLHYFERNYNGEPNYEDRDKESFGGDLDKKVKSELAAEQQLIDSLLIAKLMSNPRMTNTVLNEVYGLGTEAPESFALFFTVRANDKSACSALEYSKQALSEASPDSFDAPREKLDSAIASLKCS